ncbi:MAG: NAD(P)/FAD-dependent oxidoreductase, partial [Frisingicoccus sp.]
MSESIWEKNLSIPERGQLEETIKTDVCIIGAGMAGILTGYLLQKQGLGVVILEADRIGSGQTRGTTAKITSQHGLIYSRLCRNFGTAGAWQYASANEAAIDTYERIIDEEHISCDFKRCASYLYTRKSTELLEEEAEAARLGGIAASLTKEIELPVNISAALRFPNQAAFHPLKFLQALSEKLDIYEKSKVLKVTGRKVETEFGRVWAKHIIFACHFPFINIPGYYFMRLY